MSALYKGFNRAKPAFFGLAVALALAFCPPVSAQPSYTVEGVEVDVTAANAVKAREEALKQAQVKAFEQLALTTLGEEGMAAYSMPDPDTVMALVQDFEVTNEQLSSRRYKGVFTVRFRPALAQQYLVARPVVPAYPDQADIADIYAGDPAQTGYQPPHPAYEQRTAGASPQAPAYQPPPVHRQAAPTYHQPAPAAHGQKAMIRARFANVQEWVRLKQALERNRAFSLYRIASLQPTEALVELVYNGSAADLQQAIAGAGLSVFPAQGVVTVNTASPLFDVGFGGYSRY